MTGGRFDPMASQGAGGLFRRMRDDLAWGSSVVLLLPRGVSPPDAWDRVRQEIGGDLESLTLRPGGGDGVSVPSALLARSFEEHCDLEALPRSVEGVAAARGLPGVTCLLGLEDLAEGARSEWLAFLTRWARSCQGVADGGGAPPALFVPLPAEAAPDPPAEDACLRLHWWWGVPSALDVRQMCRHARDAEESPLRARWREALLASVCGGDAALAEHLWERLSCFEELAEEMAFALAGWNPHGWTEEALRRAGADRVGEPGRGNAARPSAAARDLWAMGAACHTPEYGLELHAAALPLLGGEEEIKRRLWRGQAELLLPLADELRQGVCRALTRDHGPGWPLEWDAPDTGRPDLDAAHAAALRQSPLACELGYLEHLLANCPALRRHADRRALVRELRTLRNLLSHYQLVTLARVEGALRLARAARVACALG